MSSRYDELPKPKSPEPPVPAQPEVTAASSARFEVLDASLLAAQQTAKDKEVRAESRERTERDFPANRDAALSLQGRTGRSEPMQVFIDPHNPQSFSPDAASRAVQKNALSPAPGGTMFQTGVGQRSSEAQRAEKDRAPSDPFGSPRKPEQARAREAAESQRQVTDPFGRPRQTGQERAGEKRAEPSLWDKPRGEMSDRAQGAMNRESAREMTDQRQANPFTREMSEKAQRLVNAIGTPTKGPSRGRD